MVNENCWTSPFAKSKVISLVGSVEPSSQEYEKSPDPPETFGSKVTKSLLQAKYWGESILIGGYSKTFTQSSTGPTIWSPQLSLTIKLKVVLLFALTSIDSSLEITFPEESCHSYS